jgi:hypothetical protein
VLEALFARPDRVRALEERKYDEFASTVLLPDALLDVARGPRVPLRLCAR